ncbi:MAG: protein-glutamate O-methyltransferase CheR [Desulfovibrionaceae bacterium]
MALSSLHSLNLRQSPKISDQEFQELRDFIYSSTGIDIPARRKYLLETRLGKRLSELGLKTYADYYKHLRFARNKNEEMDKLFEQVTTNETSFFRDIKQLEVFQNFVLKETLEKQQATKDIHIWSAGCSSGEEPYTLGIYLHEALRMGVMSWKARISASDLSPAVLSKARQGLYGDYSFKTTQPDMLARYFTKEPGGYRIHPKVQKLVQFSQINLNDKLAIKRIPKSHIIFCRNVIIYFDDEMKKRVLDSFYDNLLPGGYLVLGHSESVHKLTRAFKPVIKIGGVVYRKEE